MDIKKFIKDCNFDNTTIIEVGVNLGLNEYKVYRYELDTMMDSKIVNVDFLIFDKFDESHLLGARKMIVKTEYLYIKDCLSYENISRFENLFLGWRIRLQDNLEVLFENIVYHTKGINSNGAWNTKNLNEHYFDNTLAEAISNYLRMNDVKSCVDFGCGEGKYVEYFNKDKIKTTGFDGNPYTKEITNGKCSVLNLSESFNLHTNFDCVISLEVGEHIPEKYESIFINNIVNHANNLIIISWAIPKQGGFGHVNCKNNEYIREQFTKRGFESQMYLENIIRLTASANWFKRTIMIFKKITK